MKLINKKLVLLSFLTLTFCNQKKEKENEIVKKNVLEQSDKSCIDLSSTAGLYTSYLIDNERMKILYDKMRKGDTIAYIKCEEIYMLSGHGEAFLTNSIIMANENSYSQAY